MVDLAGEHLARCPQGVLVGALATVLGVSRASAASALGVLVQDGRAHRTDTSVPHRTGVGASHAHRYYPGPGPGADRPVGVSRGKVVRPRVTPTPPSDAGTAARSETDAIVERAREIIAADPRWALYVGREPTTGDVEIILLRAGLRALEGT